MEENPTSDEKKGIEENSSTDGETNAESGGSENKDKINEEQTSVSNGETNAADADKEVINQDSQDNTNDSGASEPVKEEIKEEPSKDNSDQSSEPANEQSETQIEVVEEKEEPVEEKKEETPVVPKSKEGKEGSWMPMIIIMGVSLVIAFAWDKVDVIRNSVHAVLDPSAGALLAWNPTMGMLIIVLCIGLLTTFIQKYATDQAALRELKKEQKILQEEMKKYKDHPEKVAELSKKQLQFIPKTFKLTSRAVMFTGIPFILFFRWFTDYFASFPDFKFFGFLSWFWFYFIFTMVFSTILRKALKVV